MPFRASGPGTVNEIDRWDGGVGWIAHPEEGMQRASHALNTAAGVIVVDPVDAADLDDWLAELGEVVGVALLLDRHLRHCAEVATRHDVPVYVPAMMDDLQSELDAAVELREQHLPETDYELVPVVNSTIIPTEPFRWREAALYNAETQTLVVPESFGTTPYMTVGDERLGVHPMRRLTPPSRLRDLAVDRILVGHGEGIHDHADLAISYALRGARRRAPRLYLKTLRQAL